MLADIHILDRGHHLHIHCHSIASLSSNSSIKKLTSKPLMTRPKTVCLLSSHGVGTVVIKNCDPLLLGPAFAMETVNGRSCLLAIHHHELSTDRAG
jgi:hypothetical protein